MELPRGAHTGLQICERLVPAISRSVYRHELPLLVACAESSLSSLCPLHNLAAYLQPVVPKLNTPLVGPQKQLLMSFCERRMT